MLQVVSALLTATVVTIQLYYVSSQETTLTPKPENSETSYNKVTFENVASKYQNMMPGCFNGFDKEFEHKQNFGLIAVSSKLHLRDCELCELNRMVVAGINAQHKYLDLEITQGIAYLPYVNIRCHLFIERMSTPWYTRIDGKASRISADLTIVQSDDLSLVWFKYKLLTIPQLKFHVVDSEGWKSVGKYFFHDMTVYLTQVMSEKLETAVPLYLKKVAKEFIVETPSSSSGKEMAKQVF